MIERLSASQAAGTDDAQLNPANWSIKTFFLAYT